MPSDSLHPPLSAAASQDDPSKVLAKGGGEEAGKRRGRGRKQRNTK
jgi:hypothetical protein